jgi:hypothetical protein
MQIRLRRFDITPAGVGLFKLNWIVFVPELDYPPFHGTCHGQMTLSEDFVMAMQDGDGSVIKSIFDAIHSEVDEAAKRLLKERDEE